MVSNTLRKYGKEESMEHGVSLRTGIKLASDHQKKYGSGYFKEAEKMEKKLLARKNRKRKRN